MNTYVAVFVYGKGRVHEMSFDEYDIPAAWDEANRVGVVQFGTGAAWEIVAVFNIEHAAAVLSTLGE